MLALGCDQAGYGLMQEVKNTWMREGLSMSTVVHTPKTPWIIRFTPKRW